MNDSSGMNDERQFHVKLSEESLTRPPEEVFDILGKIGEGSYGAVYKAMHKESGELFAIKQVPVDTDLQEIIKEISMMQQCDSPFVVKYYGSYFKDTDLWIVMEYCGGGSVSDVIKRRTRTLHEDQIATILGMALKGLEYLHFKRKIHRDIKAGNILLNTQGQAKLADFGVAGQLTDTMAKRNTVIGTPFWMAPEVIQEVGYDCVADIWSLGITAMEMAEGKPPYADIHPMRAIFMIPSKPPPTLKDSTRWSVEFQDFLSKCLVKNPEERSTATALLKHPFIKGAKPLAILQDMVVEAMQALERRVNMGSDEEEEDDDDDVDQGTTQFSEIDSGTMIAHSSGDSSLATDSEMGTMISHDASMLSMSSAGSQVNTMVINHSEDGAFDDDTMKRVDTMRIDDQTALQKSDDYRPAFMDHFDRVDAGQSSGGDPSSPSNSKRRPQATESPRMVDEDWKTADGNFDFLKSLSVEELQRRLTFLDPDMEKDLEELRQRYQAKRKPILDALDVKRKKQKQSAAATGKHF